GAPGDGAGSTRVNRASLLRGSRPRRPVRRPRRHRALSRDPRHAGCPRAQARGAARRGAHDRGGARVRGRERPGARLARGGQHGRRLLVLPHQGRPARRRGPAGRRPRARRGPRGRRPQGDDPPDGSTVARLSRAVDTFARRALRGPTLAWALLLEPVDPAVDVARLEYRRAYAATFADVVRDGVAAGELPEQDVDVVASALVGAIGEALTGPLSPPAAGGEDGDGAPADPDARDAVVATILRVCLGAVGARVPAREPT